MLRHWCVAGEARSYNTVQGAFREVLPQETVTSGGPGAVELVARFSDIDLDSGTLQGGKFWRFTPMVNWYFTTTCASRATMALDISINSTSKAIPNSLRLASKSSSEDLAVSKKWTLL